MPVTNIHERKQIGKQKWLHTTTTTTNENNENKLLICEMQIDNANTFYRLN